MIRENVSLTTLRSGYYVSWSDFITKVFFAMSMHQTSHQLSHRCRNYVKSLLRMTEIHQELKWPRRRLWWCFEKTHLTGLMVLQLMGSHVHSILLWKRGIILNNFRVICSHQKKLWFSHDGKVIYNVAENMWWSFNIILHKNLSKAEFYSSFC